MSFEEAGETPGRPYTSLIFLLKNGILGPVRSVNNAVNNIYERKRKNKRAVRSVVAVVAAAAVVEAVVPVVAVVTALNPACSTGALLIGPY